MRQPLLATGHQITSSERVGEFLETLGRCAIEESVGALLEADTIFVHSVGQPVMLIEADPGREGMVGTHANKYASPAGVVDIDVVFNNPSL